jgi:hypothetical protein
MTRQEANKAGVHDQCGGKLLSQERHKKGTVWEVAIRCAKCGKGMVTTGPYRRPLEGDAARQDRRQRAVVEFNEGAPWEEQNEWGR